MANAFAGFNPETTRYAAGNALAMAHAAKAAYLPSEVAMQQLATSWNFSDLKLVSRALRKPFVVDTQYFIARSDKAVLLAFRGTEPTNLDDWMTDLTALPARFDPGSMAGSHAHTGFFHALDVVWPVLVDQIKTMQTEGRSLWITGHSLGGALATLAAARLKSAFDWPINGIYTFGSPRACFADLANGYNLSLGLRTFRFVNNTDIVTRVPTRGLGYSHVGQFLFFDDEGKLSADPHWWNRLLSLIEVNLTRFGDWIADVRQGELPQALKLLAPTAFDDHGMAHYVAWVEANKGDPFANGAGSPGEAD